MLRIFDRRRRIWRLMSENNQFLQEQGAFEDQLSPELGSNLARFSACLGTSSDIIIREFSIGTHEPVLAALIYIDGLVNKDQVDRDILAPLTSRGEVPPASATPQDLFEIIKTRIAVGEIQESAFFDELTDRVLTGDTVLIIDGFREAIISSTKEYETRVIQEPPSQVVVRGPREGFTENLRTNTALLRQRVRNPKLTFETIRIGKQTRTDVCITYIKGLSSDSLITEIKRRLQRIKIDAILESGYIEEFIEDAPFSLFPTIYNTERPDAVAGKLLEGRAAILVGGTPFVLTVPTLFAEFFQSPEDYYSRYFYGSFLRLIRFVAFFISILLPAVYVALINYHQELMPTSLLITFAAAREGLPFPAFLETIGMGLIFEILREAGIRLPRPIGQAISIVGALVIGQTAVSAGLIGAPMVIIVALTAITSFVTPHFSEMSAYLRVGFTILAGLAGGFGLLMGLLIVLIHMASLRSFGIPYLAPVMPFNISGQKDIFLRAPWWTMFTRPEEINKVDPKRQEFRLRPQPPKE